jgi:hypothetical protein
MLILKNTKKPQRFLWGFLYGADLLIIIHSSATSIALCPSSNPRHNNMKFADRTLAESTAIDAWIRVNVIFVPQY